jgi:uncharacterized protein with NAD-binding domain and iron-sulfur cluster
MAAQKVVILGGGVAGLSAAHELIERGFTVEVYEKKSIAGGKARSLPAIAPWRDAPVAPDRPASASSESAAKPLPGEHGFRFFPGFYRHVIDTMTRIPCPRGSVADHLVEAREVRLAPFGGPSYSLPARFPGSTADLKVDLFALIALLSGAAGVGLDDGAFFASKIWEFATSCTERRFTEYERISWWDFIGADTRSAAYQKYFGSGITRSLVAAKARRASTKTIGDIFVQIVLGVLVPGAAADRLLDGPTSEVWIEPWVAYLRERGVVYHTDAEVCALRCERGRLASAIVRQGTALREITGDFFIGALPVERMVELAQPLLKCDPSLASLYELTEYVEWMNGIQFYLTRDAPITDGHAIYVDSPWALTSVSQAQFWRDYDLESYADGRVRGILSVDISDWDVPGLNGKKAQNCARREIALETWEQLKRSVNHLREELRDEDLHSWFLDPDIEDIDNDGNPATPRLDTNAEPLLVNYVDTWRIRPEAVTRIPNFFLASDYVRTFTDLATMEAANEAARRAVNGVLVAAGRESEPCELWNLHEPEPFVPLRAHDRKRFREGLPWDERTIALARHALALSEHAGAWPRNVTGESSAPAATRDASGLAAAEARASSDTGLRRLRIQP